jgi:phospholipid/cholesterol/gamma-HCH transport system substrate-binding protein
VTAVRLPNLEQLLVTYPVIISSGFTGTTKDGFGHVHLEYTREPPPCRDGYLPPSEWRPPADTSDGKVFLKAHCDSPPPFASRGANYVPEPRDGSARVAPYDPETGSVADRQRFYLDSQGVGDVYGEDAWKWMLIGPTLPR